MIMNKKIKYVSGILLATLLVVGIGSIVWAQNEIPRRPHVFWGKVTIADQVAPEGVTVNARNLDGEVVASDEVGDQGYYKLKVDYMNQQVFFYVRDYDTGKTHSVEIGGITENLDLHVDDTTAPTIEIDSPSDGELVTESSVTVEGSITDDFALYDEITATVNGETITLDSDSTFSEEVSLDSGSNEITVTAEDTVGNTAEESITVISDTESPSIQVDAPSMVNTKEATVTGTVTDDVSTYEELDVTLNNSTVELESDGGFSETVSLVKGSNSFTIMAEDEVGRSESREFTIVSDTQGPTVSISKPADGKVVSESTVDVEGSVDDDVAESDELTVTLNGEQVIVTDGSFSQEISIDPGPNTITATAEDPAGNSNSDEVTVIRDAEKPQLTIDSPEEGLTTKEDTVTVEGSVSDDVSEPEDIEVTVNGNDVNVGTDGSFSTEVSLEMGSNDIEVEAEDEAGRSTSARRTVERISPTPWALYAAIIAIIAVILAALAIWRARTRSSGGEGL